MGKKMMGIQKIVSNGVDELVAFSWDLCKNNTHCSYPIYDSAIEMKVKFSGSELFGYYDESKLKGVLCFCTIPNDKYLQTIGFSVYDEKVADEFLEYINENFNSFSSYIGITKENKIVSESLLKKGYHCIDDSVMMKLNFVNYAVMNDSKVTRITLTNKESYLKFHNIHFEDGYWNTKRISENFDEWYIISIIKRNAIVGAAFIKDYKNNKSEIFGIYANDEIVYTDLIRGLLNDYRLNKQNIIEMICMVECENVLLLNVMEQFGFSYNSSYCCYVNK